MSVVDFSRLSVNARNSKTLWVQKTNMNTQDFPQFFCFMGKFRMLMWFVWAIAVRVQAHVDGKILKTYFNLRFLPASQTLHSPFYPRLRVDSSLINNNSTIKCLVNICRRYRCNANVSITVITGRLVQHIPSNWVCLCFGAKLEFSWFLLLLHRFFYIILMNLFASKWMRILNLKDLFFRILLIGCGATECVQCQKQSENPFSNACVFLWTYM